MKRSPIKRKPKKNPMPEGRYEEVMRRDGDCRGNLYGLSHRCSGPLEVHHMKGRGMGGTQDPSIHDPENLLVLCQWAHQWAESNRTRAYEMGLAIRREA